MYNEDYPGVETPIITSFDDAVVNNNNDLPSFDGDEDEDSDIEEEGCGYFSRSKRVLRHYEEDLTNEIEDEDEDDDDEDEYDEDDEDDEF